MSMSVALSLCLSRSLRLCLPISIRLSVVLSFSGRLSVVLSLSVTQSAFLCHSPALSFSVSVFPFLLPFFTNLGKGEPFEIHRIVDGISVVREKFDVG